MSNIVREMNGRLGRDWVGDGVIEISSSHGPGIWCVFFFSDFISSFLLLRHPLESKRMKEEEEGPRLAEMGC